MDTEERIRKQKELVETIGLRAEREGMQPVTSRVMALLMVMDREEYTFDEIVAELKISKSSASMALKTLQIREIIEYTTRPGDRKRYFRIKYKEPFFVFEEFRRALSEKKKDMISICELKANPDNRVCSFFSDMIGITDFFLERIDQLKEEYLKQKKSS